MKKTNINLSVWKKVCSYCVITSLIMYVLTILFFTELGNNLQFRIGSYYLMITLLIYSFIFVSKEKNKIKIILWLETLIITINLQWFITDLSWIRFFIQIILVVILYFSYKRANLTH